MCGSAERRSARSIRLRRQVRHHPGYNCCRLARRRRAACIAGHLARTRRSGRRSQTLRDVEAVARGRGRGGSGGVRLAVRQPPVTLSVNPQGSVFALCSGGGLYSREDDGRLLEPGALTRRLRPRPPELVHLQLVHEVGDGLEGVEVRHDAGVCRGIATHCLWIMRFLFFILLQKHVL